MSGCTNTPLLPAEPDDFAWTSSYFFTHLMTDQSRRYGYILWFIVCAILFPASILHWAGSRGGWIGAWWTKNTLRRRTWRKKSAVKRHRQPVALPSISQLIALFILLLSVMLLSTVGTDYIIADDFLLKNNLPKFLGGNLHTRADIQAPLGCPTNATSFGSGPLYSATRYTPLQVDYPIAKQWWTSANRFGIIAYALMPLCVIFVLKAAPFNIFAIKYFLQIHSDKLAYLHRWSGRFTIGLVFGHVALWSVQLLVDRRLGTNQPAYLLAFLWQDFVYGWIGFILFMLIGITSLPYFRENHYNIFYYMHFILVPLALIAAAEHHPPTGWWAWTALAFWGAERLFRELRKMWMNGHMRSLKVKPTVNTMEKWDPDAKDEDKEAAMKAAEEDPPQYLYPDAKREQSYDSEYAPLAPTMAISSLTIGYLPPPGFVHAELVAGRTIRLRMVTPGFITWAPGQYFNVKIPSVSYFGSHPFTTASICDEQSNTNDGRVIVFLIRAKEGWTKDLWDHLALLTERRLTHPPNEIPPVNATLPPRGALLRMHVDGPFGSAVRAKWGHHSTVLIVAGGSGVSFGLSILEFTTMCMAGRDAESLGSSAGGWHTKRSHISRVRFVWLVREFSHIQWCATAIRRCLAIAPPGQLQVDIHVTLAKPDPPANLPDPTMKPAANVIKFPQQGEPEHLPEEETDKLLAYGERPRLRERTSSTTSADDEDDTNDLPNPHYHDDQHHDVETGSIAENEDEHPLDFTNFDGEDDGAIAGEAAFSRNIRLEGKVRRANTRKATRDQAEAAAGQTDLPPPTPRRFDHGIPNSPLAASPLTGSGRFNPTVLATIHQSPEIPSRHNSDRLSMISAASDDMMTAPSMTEVNKEDEELRLDVDVAEVDDIAYLSEFALKGRPKLDRIIKTEQERAKGSMVVATCGPTALNANLRKIIAARIDPARVRRGDMRGSIELISEEFNV